VAVFSIADEAVEGVKLAPAGKADLNARARYRAMPCDVPRPSAAAARTTATQLTSTARRLLIIARISRRRRRRVI